MLPVELPPSVLQRLQELAGLEGSVVEVVVEATPDRPSFGAPLPASVGDLSLAQAAKLDVARMWAAGPEDDGSTGCTLRALSPERQRERTALMLVVAATMLAQGRHPEVVEVLLSSDRQLAAGQEEAWIWLSTAALRSSPSMSPADFSGDLYLAEALAARVPEGDAQTRRAIAQDAVSRAAWVLLAGEPRMGADMLIARARAFQPDHPAIAEVAVVHNQVTHPYSTLPPE